MLNRVRAFSKQNPLLASASNLMLSAGITAALGFVFWTVIAHTFRTETIGIATTLLSMSTLLSLMGLAGFDTIFVRYLPKSKHRNEQINSGLVIAGITSAIFGILFCVLLPILSPKLSFVDSNPWYIASFIVFTVFTTWNTLTNAVLVAYRRTSFVVAINIIFSAVKLALPFIVRSGGPMTIFAFVGVAQVVNVILSIAALMRYFDYVPSFKIHFGLVRETLRFGSATYAAQLLNLLPDSSLPLIVVNKLGPTAAAYFYIAFTIANLLYTIAFSTAQALLAEASHDEEHIVQHLRKGIVMISVLLIPATIVLIVVCPFILAFFGEAYRSGATGLLRIMSISSIAVMIYSALGTVFKLTRNLKAILATTATNAVVIVTLSIVVAKPWGLNGIGWAWLIGSWASVIVGLWFVRDWLRISRRMPAPAEA